MLSLVRRPIFSSASFLPSDIADLVLWLEADLLSLNDNDAVGTWGDSSGTGHDVTQGTATKKPTFKTNIVNGLPVVRFDGTNDLLSSGLVNFTNATATIFIVCTGSSTANGDALVVDAADGNTFYEMRVDSTSQLAFRAVTLGTTTEDTQSQTGTFMVMGGVRGTSSVTAYINGVTNSSATPSGSQKTGNSKFQIGEFGLGFQFFGGDIAEVLFYNNDIGTTNRQAVEDYLGAKYAITITH